MTKHERDGEEKSRIASVYRKCRIAKLVKDVEESQAQAPFFQESLLELEKDIAESHVAIQAQLHELAFDLETEITKELQLQGRNVSTFSMALVKANHGRRFLKQSQDGTWVFGFGS